MKIWNWLLFPCLGLLLSSQAVALQIKLYRQDIGPSLRVEENAAKLVKTEDFQAPPVDSLKKEVLLPTASYDGKFYYWPQDREKTYELPTPTVRSKMIITYKPVIEALPSTVKNGHRYDSQADELQFRFNYRIKWQGDIKIILASDFDFDNAAQVWVLGPSSFEYEHVVSAGWDTKIEAGAELLATSGEVKQSHDGSRGLLANQHPFDSLGLKEKLSTFSSLKLGVDVTNRDNMVGMPSTKDYGDPFLGFGADTDRDMGEKSKEREKRREYGTVLEALERQLIDQERSMEKAANSLASKIISLIENEGFRESVDSALKGLDAPKWNLSPMPPPHHELAYAFPDMSKESFKFVRDMSMYPFIALDKPIIGRLRIPMRHVSCNSVSAGGATFVIPQPQQTVNADLSVEIGKSCASIFSARDMQFSILNKVSPHRTVGGAAKQEWRDLKEVRFTGTLSSSGSNGGADSKLPANHPSKAVYQSQDKRSGGAGRSNPQTSSPETSPFIVSKDAYLECKFEVTPPEGGGIFRLQTTGELSKRLMVNGLEQRFAFDDDSRQLWNEDMQPRGSELIVEGKTSGCGSAKSGGGLSLDQSAELARQADPDWCPECGLTDIGLGHYEVSNPALFYKTTRGRDVQGLLQRGQGQKFDVVTHNEALLKATRTQTLSTGRQGPANIPGPERKALSNSNTSLAAKNNRKTDALTRRAGLRRQDATQPEREGAQISPNIDNRSDVLENQVSRSANRQIKPSEGDVSQRSGARGLQRTREVTKKDADNSAQALNNKAASQALNPQLNPPKGRVSSRVPMNMSVAQGNNPQPGPVKSQGLLLSVTNFRTAKTTLGPTEKPQFEVVMRNTGGAVLPASEKLRLTCVTANGVCPFSKADYPVSEGLQPNAGAVKKIELRSALKPGSYIFSVMPVGSKQVTKQLQITVISGAAKTGDSRFKR